ncbi:tetratricopeptide repeat protein [Oceanicaulis sp.]|uniref:tetratricopeptide repeat protein n=1 Tax=Oceanicaulis sp. TaxID=1924941 RepID=UPI003BAB8976
MSTHSFQTRQNKPLMQALTGGACGLAMAALLAVAVSFAFSGRALGQAQQAATYETDARYECEAGAREAGATGRALGACDLLLRDASVSGETRARVLTNRAVMLLARGQNVQARSDLEEAVELAPDLAEAWLNLSAAQITTGSAQQAIETARQAGELGASPALTAFNTAIALETLGRFEDAYAAYNQAAQQDPENMTLAAQPGRFIWHQG